MMNSTLGIGNMSVWKFFENGKFLLSIYILAKGGNGPKSPKLILKFWRLLFGSTSLI